MNNNAYTSFIKNLENNNIVLPSESYRKTYKTIESFCDDIAKYNYLYHSFLWNLTPEGYDYWKKLNLNWRDYLEKNWT